MTSAPGKLSQAQHRFLLTVVAAYIVVLVLAGPHLHPVGIRAAIDQYAERAEAMLDGVWKPDPYHPYLYPELVALLTAIVGDGFAAARVVSSLAAGLFVYSGTRLVHACHGGASAAWTATWLVANGSIVVGGVEAGSDMTASALAVTGIWRLLRPPCCSAVVSAGLCFGLAIATRYNVAGLLPAIGVVTLFADRTATFSQQLRRLALGAFATLVGYLPSLLPNLLVLGTAIPGQSWRNLAYKLSPTADPNSLAGAHSSLGNLLAEQGTDLVGRTLTDFTAIWTHHLGATLFGERADPALAAIGTVLFVGCAIAALLRRPRHAWPGLLLTTTWTGAIALTFFPQVRLLVCILPLVAGITSATCIGTTRRLGHGMCALVTLAIACSSWPTVRDFVDDHPLPEIHAARAVAAREGPLVRIASCYPLMQRHVAARIVYVSPPGRGAMTAENLVARVLEAIERERCEYLVAGRVTTPLPSLDDLRRFAPANFVVESLDSEVLVARFQAHDADWLDLAEATTTEDGRLRLRLVTRIDVGMAGFQVRSPDGVLALIPLSNSGSRTFELIVARPAGDSRQLELTPCAVLPSGVPLRASSMRIDDTRTATGK